jgi:pyruvate/2-oxoglutarate/acetoin dehydrogenase E1 component
MAGKKPTARDKSVSESVADLATTHNLDQVVVIGWREKGGRYVMVAHGQNAAEQKEAEIFAERLMAGIGAPAERTDRYYGKEDSSAKEG